MTRAKLMWQAICAAAIVTALIAGGQLRVRLAFVHDAEHVTHNGPR